MKRASFTSSFNFVAQRDVVRFVGKLFLFAFLMLSVDQFFALATRAIPGQPALHIWAQAMLAKQKQMRQTVTTLPHSIDVLVVGSSHLQFGFATSTFSQITGKSAYNAASGDHRISEMERTFEEFSANRTIGSLVVGLDSFSLNESDAVLVAPTSSVVETHANRNVIDLIGKYSNAARSWPYIKSRGSELLYSLFRRVPSSEFASFRGFIVHDGGWVEGEGLANIQRHRYDGVTFNPSPSKVAALDKIFEMCRSRGTELILVQAPEHKVLHEHGPGRYVSYLEFVRKWTVPHDVEFIDMDRVEAFPIDDDRLFFDADHLNSDGAKLFTRKLAEFLVSKGR